MTEEKSLQRHLNNRDKLLATIVGEVFGPGSRFDSGQDLLADQTPLDLSGPVTFEDWKAYSGVRPVVQDTGEEILRGERPTSRFGMGILFPETDEAAHEADEERLVVEEAGTLEGEESEEALGGEEEKASKKREKLDLARQKKLERQAENIGKSADTTSIDDDSDSATETADLRLANLRRQRSIGVSMVVDASSPGDLVVRVIGGRYKRFTDVRIKERKSEREIVWWARRKVDTPVAVPFSEILRADNTTIRRIVEIASEAGLPDLKLSVEILVRGRERIPGDEHCSSARLLTVTLVNRGKCKKQESLDERSFFQARFSVAASGGSEAILPYPQARLMNEGAEQQSLDLLYRHEFTFATGHGCAGTWEADENAGFAQSVCADVLPSHESPAITPDLQFRDAGTGDLKDLRISLALLADDERFDEGLEQLRLMLRLYKEWIGGRREEVEQLPEHHQAAAKRHLKACDVALARMEAGIQLLSKDPGSDVSVAFRLTNQAMLMQALASRAPTRQRQLDSKERRIFYEPDYAEPEPSSKAWQDRAWYPFQISFFLMNLAALADSQDPGREIVDLIWFPTGGGKTEAYLACASFSIFMRRMADRDDLGTQVLMRYTLRLLTAQQFQRASSLICAMELIRADREESLGTAPFTIGIWVGGATTPNRRSGAASALKKTRRNGEEDYKMILLKCPWCGAAMGPARRPGQGHGFDVHGVRKVGEEVFLHCPDKKCKFSKRLPMEVVDEEIYERPPTYVIATVDKFAALAWRQECRSLFGIGEDGQRNASPPGLIIQDELHLITGPLGSMVGLYETLVDELATDRRDPEHPVKPKLIAATATTRASDRQIRDLYARNQTSIFPAPGLDAADSFFAKYDRDKFGKRKSGRRYVGFLPLNFSSALTASVRLYSAALSAAFGFSAEEERDPWWTLLVFYNSLRELGANLTLFGADIPERMKDVQRRWYPGEHMRFVNDVLELTGRLANSEVPRALEALGRRYKAKPASGQWPVDACLASNIIEVGVDVDRLGLMAVAGQPKTTAQYIQATGRVGRALPGLILVNYGATKARDRSHYEHFQAYHSRLYAQVEPASVTPFTIPVLERALHAILVAAARQTLPLADLASPSPFSGTTLESAVSTARELLERRIEALAAGDIPARDRMTHDLNECYQRRLDEWKKYRPVIWHEYFPKKDSGNQPLIRPYGSPCPVHWENVTWETPNSLRGVDAECTPSIPDPLLEEDE